MALHGVEGVGGHVLAGDEPGGVVAAAARRAFFLDAADAQALPLAQGVEAQAHVLADGAALARLDGAGARLQVAAQEFAKGPLADEANAGGVFLFGVGQPGFGGDAAHVAFAQIAHGKERAGKLRLREAVQKVALVFGRIGALEQLVAARGGVQALAGVVAGGNFFGAQAHGVVQKGLELDFGIAQYVRVGRAAGLVFAQEFGKDAVFVFGGEIDVLDVDADHVGHGGGVQKVLAAGAVLAVIVVFPVFHEDANDIVTLLF